MDFIPVLKTERLVLTIPEPSASSHMLAYVVDNERHLARWEPPRPEGYFTDHYWKQRLEKNRYEHAKDISLRLTARERRDPDGPVVGHMNLSQIFRGPFHAAYLGYSVDHRCQGKGYMFEAARAVIDFAFGTMALHRIMANYIPTNERSGRLLRRLGFVVEGYARDYLFIHDRWQDHVLTALTNPRPLVPVMAG